MNSQVKRSMGKVWKHPKHRSWHRDVFTDPEALWILHFGDFYEGCIAYAWLIINSISSESLHLSGNSAPFLHCTKMIECRQSHVTPSANSVCVCLFSYNVKLLNVLSIFFFFFNLEDLVILSRTVFWRFLWPRWAVNFEVAMGTSVFFFFFNYWYRGKKSCHDYLKGEQMKHWKIWKKWKT